MTWLPSSETDRAALGLIAFFTALRLGVSPFFGLGVDEAHYVLYGKYLDLSYVDHPPLVGWVHGLIYHLLGTNAFLARLPAILLFAATSWCVYRFALEVSGSHRRSLLALAAVNGSFILNAMGLMLLPDDFLLWLAFPFMAVVRRIEARGRTADFVLLGLLLGLAGLAKYTAILFVPPLVIYYGLKRRFDLLFAPRMLLAAGIALALVTPVLWWNWNHDFLSFRYQTGHVLAPIPASAKSFFVSLLAQFGAYSPFLFGIAFYGFVRACLAKDDLLRLASLVGGTVLLFFCYGSFYERTLPHWPSLFYLLFIPVGVVFLLADGTRFKRNLVFVSLGFSLAVTLFLYVALPLKPFAFPDYKSPFRDIYGVQTVARKAQAIAAGNGAAKTAVAVSNWTYGSRMMYYSLSYRAPVYVIDRRTDQFDVWEQEPPQGYDLLFLSTHFHEVDVNRTFRCDAVDPADRLDIVLNGKKVDSVEYVWCRNFQGWRE